MLSINLVHMQLSRLNENGNCIWAEALFRCLLEAKLGGCGCNTMNAQKSLSGLYKHPALSVQLRIILDSVCATPSFLFNFSNYEPSSREIISFELQERFLSERHITMVAARWDKYYVNYNLKVLLFQIYSYRINQINYRTVNK